MKVTVVQLYKNGKSLARGEKVRTFEGDLDVSDRMHPVLGRLVREAVLLSDGRHVIDPIIDVQLICVSADGMRLRGVEYYNGAERVQEWSVRPRAWREYE